MKVFLLDRKKRENLGARNTCKALSMIFKGEKIDIVGTFDNDYVDCISNYLDPRELANKIIEDSKENSRIKLMLTEMQMADAVIINGEGSMIFSSAMPIRSHLSLYLAIIYIAKSYGLITAYINSVCTADPDGNIDKQTLDVCKDFSKYFDFFVVRDKVSFEYAQRYLNANVQYIPEALFGWSVFYDRCNSMNAPIGEMIFTSPEDDYDYGKYNFDDPYVLIGGYNYEADVDKNKTLSRWIEVISYIKKIGFNVYIIKTSRRTESFLDELSIKSGTLTINNDLNSVMQASILGNAKLFISGRYHPSILASLGGTPCIMFKSNCLKSQGFNKYFSYLKNETVMEGISVDRCFEDILIRINKYLKNEELRDEIKKEARNIGRESISSYKQLIKNMNEIIDKVNIMLSVIIPIYNGEKYISRCLESILSQKLEDIEIICVNDGSDDNSLKILRRYEEIDERIKVINLEHAEAGEARNAGLRLSRGKYIHFMDVDDYVLPDSYNKICDYMDENNLEYAKIRCKVFSYGSKDITRLPNYSVDYLQPEQFNKIYNNKDYPDSLIYSSIRAPFGAVYLRDFLLRNKIFFNKLHCVNDRSFYVQTIINLNRFSCMDLYAVCHQTDNPFSLMGKRCDFLECHFESYNIISDMIKDYDINLQKRILTCELLDFLHWFGLSNESQKRRVADLLYRFILSIEWEKVEKTGYITERIFEVNEFLHSLNYGKAKRITKNTLVEEIKSYKYLYLYGAGVMGQTLLSYLQENGISPIKILVSDSVTVDGKDERISRIGDVVFEDEDDTIVILGAKSNYHLQMERQLIRRNISNIYFIVDEELEGLRYLYYAE